MANVYSVAVTAIIYREDGKFLITRRAENKKKWPGKWTVPGGGLEPSDYLDTPKDAENAWYDVLTKTIRREVLEEVNLEIKNIEYLTGIVAEYGEDIPHGLIISLIAEYAGGEMKLQEEELDRGEWVSVKEAEGYDLIPGIYDELLMADEWVRGNRVTWDEIKGKK